MEVVSNKLQESNNLKMILDLSNYYIKDSIKMYLIALVSEIQSTTHLIQHPINKIIDFHQSLIEKSKNINNLKDKLSKLQL